MEDLTPILLPSYSPELSLLRDFMEKSERVLLIDFFKTLKFRKILSKRKL